MRRFLLSTTAVILGLSIVAVFFRGPSPAAPSTSLRANRSNFSADSPPPSLASAVESGLPSDPKSTAASAVKPLPKPEAVASAWTDRYRDGQKKRSEIRTRVASLQTRLKDKKNLDERDRRRLEVELADLELEDKGIFP